MKKLLPALLVCIAQAVFAQTYWQQQTDYKIEVTLNDSIHELNGFITIQYKNNSPATLDCIYMHLWPNAYRDQTTPLAKQLLENGDTKFYYSKPYQKGFIDQLDFKLNSEVCRWQYDTGSAETGRLILNNPLKPGESVRITTPFRVKLPETFSRLGHVGQSYQVSQWYPKPAVYDKTGWHTMPYLDQGEFYSEYGSFDVAITLPANYVVGATGDLQDAAEIKWMDEQAAATAQIKSFSKDMAFPRSAANTKTLHYKQENIHDFAWFADKRFHVLKGEVELPLSKKKVTTWSLFTNNQAALWAKAPEYLHDAIYYYSLWVGEYPYRQVTAVDGALSAGGGMEYPNITIVSAARNAAGLDEIITHEVGHNWFYGLLGSNEREHAWMDEGINSYYEYRYMETKYPHMGLVGKLPTGLKRFLDIEKYKRSYLMDAGYQLMARENLDQPIALHSARFTGFNYGVIVYGKSMLAFNYLEAYLGTATFDKAMKKYFETWKYKHPQPEDFKKIMEEESGRQLDWFFGDLLGSTKKIDYKISKVSNKQPGTTAVVTLKNVTGVKGPVELAVLKGDSVIRTKWLPGFERQAVTELDMAGADKVKIDPGLSIPEINRRNNTYKLKGAHKFEKLRFQFLTTLENQDRTQVCFTPYFGWNNYDKTQVGIAFYNPMVPGRKFNYLLVPAIGTGSKQFIGIARLSYNFYPEQLQRFTAGINGKRFSYLLFPENLMFNKLEPYVHIEFKKKNARSPYAHSLHMRSVIIWNDWLRFDTKQKETLRYYVNEWQYRLERNSTLHPFNITATFRQGNDFALLQAEANFKISYRKVNQGFSIRIFAGGFPAYFKDAGDIASPLPRVYLNNVTYNNFAYWLQQDYMYDENFLDRNGRDKYLGRQVANTGGGFKSFTTFGGTKKFMAAANFSSTLLRVIPIRPFAAVGAVLNDLNKADFVAEMGLSLVAIPDMIEIHLPLVTTKNIRDNQAAIGINKWYQRFTFTLKLQLQKPVDMIRRFTGR